MNPDDICTFVNLCGSVCDIILLYFFSAKTIQTKFDATTLHENRQLAAETQMFDDGSGRAEVILVWDYSLLRKTL